jgi:hypothetical protein
MQLQSACPENHEDGVEVTTSFSGKRLLKAVARQSGISPDVRLALGASSIAKCLGDECGTLIGLFRAVFQIKRSSLPVF